MTPRWELFFGGIVSLMLLPVFSQSVSAQPKPSQPVEIHITARRFEFDPRTITLQKGQPAKLIITSADVAHGFAIDEFNINVRVEAKQTQTVEFTPDRSGHFRLYCTVYCGEDHENMNGELVVEDAQTPENIKVSFDEPGVAIVESNGERFRIDTATKTVTRITEGETPAAVPHPEPKVEQAKKNTQESYDYRLINVPTPKRVVRGSLNLYFTHRFTQPIRPLDDSARQLFGL
ncbi:MAG TPA: cupredoxin domain-containing protein, partial [Pyrinomonadaceae bacterium]